MTEILERQWEEEDYQKALRGWRHILSNVEGRAAVFNLLQFCGVDRIELSNSPVVINRGLGRVEVGQHLQETIEQNFPELYLKMQEERLNVNRIRNDSRRAYYHPESSRNPESDAGIRDLFHDH